MGLDFLELKTLVLRTSSAKSEHLEEKSCQKESAEKTEDHLFWKSTTPALELLGITGGSTMLVGLVGLVMRGSVKGGAGGINWVIGGNGMESGETGGNVSVEA